MPNPSTTKRMERVHQHAGPGRDQERADHPGAAPTRPRGSPAAIRSATRATSPATVPGARAKNTAVPVAATLLAMMMSTPASKCTDHVLRQGLIAEAFSGGRDGQNERHISSPTKPGGNAMD